MLLMLFGMPIFIQEVYAAEQVKIEISYIYVNDSGENSLYVDTQYVPAGTNWGTFFGTYQKCFENGTITDADANNAWEVHVQNIQYSNTDSYYLQEICNFNRYSDCAYVTFYGYPETYEHAFFSFEYLENDELIDSGTGWDLLMPVRYVYGSDEALAFVRRNAGIYDYIAEICNKEGAQVTVEAPFSPTEMEGRWKGYKLEIVVTPAAVPELGWLTENGVSYWFENGVKQGTYDDAKGVMGDGTIRGREIYDPDSDGWYWLDSVYDGARAVNKEVWMPYIYQNETEWNQEEIAANAAASGDMAQQVINEINNRSGKWVRYDANGKMHKGWYTVAGEDARIYPDQMGNTYYYDPKTGLMAKGTVEIDGHTYYFDEITGVLQR